MEKSHCDAFKYDFDENMALSVVFGLSFVIGLILMFVGYRIFRVTVFIQVFSLTSLLTYMILREASNLSILINSLVAGCSGIILGLLGVFVKTIGLLFASLLQSVFVSSCILYVVYIFVERHSVFIAPGIVLFCFIVLALPVFKRERATSIIYFTSFGVILIMLSIDYYLNLSMLQKAAYENMLNLSQETQPCWFSWSLLGLWPILLFLGVVVQFVKTAKDYHYKGAKNWFSNDSDQKVRLLSGKSDVIAKAWMQTSTLANERYQVTASPSGDEVFLMEEATPV